jgi:formate C-acetyltransferase
MTFTKIKPDKKPERPAGAASNFSTPEKQKNEPGMNNRIQSLRKQSVETQESLSIERALITTRFYKENEGKYSAPMMRALNFMEICKQKSIYIGENELIVSERGPGPKSAPTFPELTCHSVEDFHVLNSREQQRYTISQEDIDTYEREEIIDRTENETL